MQTQLATTSRIDEIAYIGLASAQANFLIYCMTVDGDFYTTDKKHLVKLCTTLNNLYYRQLLNPDGKPYRKLLISMPPQFGKTRTLVHFCAWVLGKNNEERIITASYNDTTASDFSRYVRDEIQKRKFDDRNIVFRDIFPGTDIKKGHAGFEKWALEGQHFNYLGAGISGSVTSKGATIQVVDDLIKGATEAYSPNYLDKVWNFYAGTLMSRVSAEYGDLLEIINMTRWVDDDLIGRILSNPDISDQFYYLRMQAYDEKTDTMLCEPLLSKERYLYLEKVMDRNIFSANYQQIPLQVTGGLYTDFKTYGPDEIPVDATGRWLFEEVGAYCDTADKGNENLCLIIYGLYMGYAYILDVYYTADPMEITEPETAIRLERFNVGRPKFESNSGGRIFARNVERIYLEMFKRRIAIEQFHQSQNKEARILSHSARAQQIIIFPTDWLNRWPKFYGDVISFVKEFRKNKFDDGPDTITGVVEMIEKQDKAVPFQNPF